ncbi:hypothetical protein FRC00_001482 [Tulasnella sp. 408]|nr:hypothetical protein FRC00_001482 [Tulasnella sp. 408]
MSFDPPLRSRDQATNEDKEFLREDASPFSSDGEIAVCKAILSGVKDIALIVEPEGAILASVLSLADGLLSMAEDSSDQTAAITKALKESDLEKAVSSGTKGLTDFCEWLHSNQADLKGLETKHKVTQGEIVNVSDDSDDWLKEHIQAELISQTNPNGTTLFTRMGLDVQDLNWDQPNIRVLCLTMDTYLFIVFHMLVVVYARRAHLALRAKDTKQWREMQQDAFKQTQVFSSTLESKIKWWTEKLEKLKQWRIDQVSKVESITTTSEFSWFSTTAYYWSDDYTKKTQQRIDEYDELNQLRSAYLGRLNSHITRTLQAEWAIVNSWKPRLEETKALLKPLKPAKAPAVQNWVEVPNVSAALKGASKVMYSYDISNEYGGTERSDWTAELDLTEHSGKCPELLLSAESVPMELKMTVYRRIAKTAGGPFENEVVAGATTGHGDRGWKDVDT